MIEIHTTSVREFMRAILPTEAHFAGPPVTFRGQADATWGLVPSVMRASAWEQLGGAERHGLRRDGNLVADGADRVSARNNAMLYTLARVIERHGLPTALTAPGYLEGFAQHLGLPTYLLDWTRSPLAAAYFAASDATKRNFQTGELVVYAMSDLYLHNSQRLESLEKPELAGFGNANLVAQQGRFIRVTCSPADLLHEVERTPLKLGETLEPNARRLVDNHFAAVTLSHERAPELLRVLRDQGIHAASLYPGNVGIAELVREVLCGDSADGASGQ